MATDKTSINFRNSLAMFEKLNSGLPPLVQLKKQPVVVTPKLTQAPVAQKTSNATKGPGEVDSTPIVKSNAIKQTLQANSVNNSKNIPNKLASSFANNPWIQQNYANKNVQKSVPSVVNKETKTDNISNLEIKKTFSETKTEENKLSESQNVVKITDNAIVDKQSLPSQLTMKIILEQRATGGIIGVKKVQQPPRRMTISDKLDQGPRQAPVIQTEMRLGSVKENANKFNDFFQNKQIEKRQADQQAKRKQKQQSKRKQEQQEKLALKQKQQESQRNNYVQKVQISQYVSQQSNTMNVSPGFLSPNPQQPVQSQCEAVSVVQSSQPSQQSIAMANTEESKDTQQNNLANRLKKRKKMAKMSFDSDED